jgi:hypothetical protein
MRWRRLAPLAALAAVLVVASIIVTRPPASGLPLDPRSSDSEGTRALVLVLERLGADVELADRLPLDDPDVVLVLSDSHDPDTAERLRDHARDGGVLVVTDPTGTVARADLGEPAGRGLFETVLERGCDMPALAETARVRVGRSWLLEPPAGASGCFGRQGFAWLVVEELGRGTLVTTGGPSFVTNALLGEEDNAVVAAAVLAPRPGTRVAILTPDFAIAEGGGTETLGSLIPLPLRIAFLQLVIAFLLLVLWKSRRLGAPVAEPQAVRLPGSELVVAVGTLLHRKGAHDRATALLREQLRRALAERLGLPEAGDAEMLAAAVAARTDVPADEVLAVLAGPPPATDTELVALAQRAESIRHAVTLPVPTGAGRADIH